MTADLAAPLRAALVGASSVTSRLSAYEGSYPVFTRRPMPAGAPYPVVMVSPDISVTDRDGVDDLQPVVERDIAVYGQNDTAAHYRDVEAIAYAVRALFHRRWRALTVSGWKVVSIIARGSIPAPTDDEQTVGRLVTLTITLARQGQG